MRRLVVPLVAALALAGCSGGDAAPGGVQMVEGQQFDPETLTVAPGTTITFTNESSEAHTVTAYDAAPEYFASGEAGSEEAAREAVGDALIPAGETYELTLDQPGTYEYFCIPHEDAGMTGTIVVEDQ